jgi:predicted aspartyl protease
MLAARLDLADRISEIAARRGTLFDYVNYIFEQAIRADNLKISLKEVLDDIWLIKTAKDAGFTILPRKLINNIIEDSYEKIGKEKMTNLWYEAGQWYGRYYDDLKKFEEAMQKYFWEITEFKVYTKDGKITLICLSSKSSEEYNLLFSNFLKGALVVLGYKTEEIEVSKGIIKLRIFKAKVNDV